MIQLFTRSNLADVQSKLGLLESDIEQARKIAVRKTFKWAAIQAARDIAKETGIPYRAARIRTKSKYRLAGSGEVWFGLNPVSVKHLGARERKGAFLAKKLNEHWFKRRGKKRLPIDRVNKPIEDDGMAYVDGTFPKEVEERMIEEFFLALDKRKGRAAGASRIIATA